MQLEHHVMLDLETWSLANNAAILTLGAVEFSFVESENRRAFYRRVDLDSCRFSGFATNSATEAWWGEQSKDAYHEAFLAEPRFPIKQVLEEFADWYWALDQGHCLWSHGAGFDVVIVEWAMKHLGVKVPWKYSSVRDTRTLYDLGGVKLSDVGTTAHKAIEDCEAQIDALRNALNSVY